MSEFIGFIFRGLAQIFGETIVGGVIGGIFQSVHWIGLWMLKLLTASSDSIKELGEKYKDSSTPYFLGFGILIGIIWLFS